MSHATSASSLGEFCLYIYFMLMLSVTAEMLFEMVLKQLQKSGTKKRMPKNQDLKTCHGSPRPGMHINDARGFFYLCVWKLHLKHSIRELTGERCSAMESMINNLRILPDIPYNASSQIYQDSRHLLSLCGYTNDSYPTTEGSTAL